MSEMIFNVGADGLLTYVGESNAGHTGELRQQITALQAENETLRQENARLKAQDNLVEGSKNSQVHAVWNASKGFR